MPIQNVPVRNGLVALALVFLLAALYRAALPKVLTLDAAFPLVLINTPGNRDVDWMNCC